MRQSYIRNGTRQTTPAIAITAAVLIAGLALLVAAPTARAAVILAIDFNAPTTATDNLTGTMSPTQSGFNAFNTGSNNGTAYPVSNTYGAYTVRLVASANGSFTVPNSNANGDMGGNGQTGTGAGTNYNFQSRNRGGPINGGSFTQQDLYRDFTNVTNAGITGAMGLQISGLAASTAYELKFYTFDVNASTTTARQMKFTNLTGNTTGSTVTISYLGDHVFSTNDEYGTGVLTVNSDAKGRLFIKEQSLTTGINPQINGFVISTVPEPAVTAMALAAIAGAALRRPTRIS